MYAFIQTIYSRKVDFGHIVPTDTILLILTLIGHKFNNLDRPLPYTNTLYIEI